MSLGHTQFDSSMATKPSLTFNRTFTCYDIEHYHSGIDYVTPDQANHGLGLRVANQRRFKYLAQQRRRRLENLKHNTGIPKTRA